MFRKVILVATLLSVLWVLTGCNTIQGIGRDITWLGDKASEASE